MPTDNQDAIPQEEADDAVIQTSPVYIGNFSEPRFGKWITEWFSKIHERVRELEWWRKDIQRRLQEGAQSFSDLRTDLGKVEKKLQPHPKPLWAIISFGFTLLSILIGGAWAAAHYPNRSEFELVKGHVIQLELHFTNEIGNLKLELAELKGTVGSVRDGVRRVEETQKNSSDKLDRLLDRHK
jgi:hypothetical protein